MTGDEARRGGVDPFDDPVDEELDDADTIQGIWIGQAGGNGDPPPRRPRELDVATIKDRLKRAAGRHDQQQREA
jgi:hypothetical protein